MLLALVTKKIHFAKKCIAILTQILLLVIFMLLQEIVPSSLEQMLRPKLDSNTI